MHDIVVRLLGKNVKKIKWAKPFSVPHSGKMILLRPFAELCFSPAFDFFGTICGSQLLTIFLVTARQQLRT